MREARGNLWTFPADARVITTNGSVRHDGRAVMGRGCAQEAMEQWPYLPAVLGDKLARFGNYVHYLGFVQRTLDRCGAPIDATDLFSFPVKHLWFEKADTELILRSARELVELVGRDGFSRVVLPRPGCGNGRLQWETVGPLLAQVLDDRFYVIHFA